MTINAREYLEKQVGPLSLGKTLRAIRLGEEESQTHFAKKLGISVQYLCDLEHDRKIVSAKKAKAFADKLGYSDKQFVRLALQDTLNQYSIPMHVEISA
ncbi:Predicted transcriptional regulator [Legionella busanensis]|uniref:Predicted transcriptional regulator n=1 Tax=Legionella busanensis TaxID=190655 RepID=A0A378KI25_9GAMM|nr:helix-turn-helix transcriptional regulator [Legionella busanensis]STX81424.1 Predicted transcriptional regulator [Legionella busanensis]